MLDVRLVNANIVTMEPETPSAHELGLWHGRIVGLDEAVSAPPARRTVDLQGATVLPGFIDATCPSRVGRPQGAGQLRQPYSVDELVDWVEHATRTCLAEGVTAVAEAGIGGGLISHSPVELAAYQQARERGRLPLRVQLMVGAEALRPAGSHPTDGIARSTPPMPAIGTTCWAASRRASTPI